MSAESEVKVAKNRSQIYLAELTTEGSKSAQKSNQWALLPASQPEQRPKPFGSHPDNSVGTGYFWVLPPHPYLDAFQ